MYNKINEAYKYIYEQYSQPIDIAIILGSGLGPLANEIENLLLLIIRTFLFFHNQQFLDMKENYILEQLREKQFVL